MEIMEFLHNYWLSIIAILFIIGVVVFITLSIRKTEKGRRNWIKTAKLGDLCHVSSISDGHLENVEIVEMDDEYVVVEVKVKKRWAYPPNK
jgi:hypothetical protein